MSLADLPQGHHHRRLNLQGQKVLAYNVFRCWVSEYQALPELDAGGNAVTIRTLKLQNEGWDRDASVPEPTRRSGCSGEPPARRVPRRGRARLHREVDLAAAHRVRGGDAGPGPHRGPRPWSPSVLARCIWRIGTITRDRRSGPEPAGRRSQAPAAAATPGHLRATGSGAADLPVAGLRRPVSLDFAIPDIPVEAAAATGPTHR